MQRDRVSTGDAAPNGDAQVEADRSVLDAVADRARPTEDGAALDGAVDRMPPFDGVRPDGSSTDSARPDSARPDSARPDSARPDSARPDSAQPDSAQPDSAQPDSAPPKPDMGIDSAPDAASGPNNGASCSTDLDCRGGARCILTIGGVGVCTMSCTQDDPITPADEDSCPDAPRSVCSRIVLTTNAVRFFCLQRCTPRDGVNECDSKLACSPSSPAVTGKFRVAACDIQACKQDSDCPVISNKPCSVTNGSGCASSSGEFCVVVGGSGRCALPGRCDLSSGLCRAHQHGSAGGAVGDPCTADTDCGNGMVCFTEQTASGRTLWANGYCTISGCTFGSTVSARKCPSGSACNHAYATAGGLCQRSCSLSASSTCRGHSADKRGDYECYPWDRFSVGGIQSTATPVCDLPTSCDFLSSGCTALTLSGNPTLMDCRDPTTHVLLADPEDPDGFCMDNTTSAP